jgi:hypothetical protein
MAATDVTPIHRSLVPKCHRSLVPTGQGSNASLVPQLWPKQWRRSRPARALRPTPL